MVAHDDDNLLLPVPYPLADPLRSRKLLLLDGSVQPAVRVPVGLLAFDCRPVDPVGEEGFRGGEGGARVAEVRVNFLELGEEDEREEGRGDGRGGEVGGEGEEGGLEGSAEGGGDEEG